MSHSNSGLNSRVLNLLKVSRNDKGLAFLVLLIFYMFSLSAVLVFFMFCAVLFAGDLFSYSFCLANECFKTFFDEISAVTSVFRNLTAFFGLVGALGVLLVALLSYLASDKTAKFTNYVSHLSLFRDYIHSEVDKLDAVSISSIDVHKVYNFIFPYSKTGSMEVSSAYKEFISMLNCEISTSNLKKSNAAGGTFIYNEHQHRIRLVFSAIGFDLPIQPKLDFYEIETQLISLIDSISLSFCGSLELKLTDRTYR